MILNTKILIKIILIFIIFIFNLFSKYLLKIKIIFKKISTFVPLKNGNSLNKFYYPIIGSRSFQKSRTIKEEKKKI